MASRESLERVVFRLNATAAAAFFSKWIVDHEKKKLANSHKCPPVLAALFQDAGLDVPQCEHKFHPARTWRFDFAWPKQKIALEVNGGIWARGRHVRGRGFLNDMEKINQAQIMGWLVMQCSPDQLKSGEIITVLQEAFASRK